MPWPEALEFATAALDLKLTEESAAFVAAARSGTKELAVHAVLTYLEGEAAQLRGDHHTAREKSREAIAKLAGETGSLAEERACAALDGGQRRPRRCTYW